MAVEYRDEIGGRNNYDLSSLGNIAALALLIFYWKTENLKRGQAEDFQRTEKT